MTFEEFKKIDLRIGKVISAERVSGSDKLLRLEVDLGEKDEAGLSALPAGRQAARQVIAGIGKVYEPEVLVGKNIVIVGNLEPRKLMGLESNGMLLAAHDDAGNPVLLITDSEVSPGSSVG